MTNISQIISIFSLYFIRRDVTVYVELGIHGEGTEEFLCSMMYSPKSKTLKQQTSHQYNRDKCVRSFFGMKSILKHMPFALAEINTHEPNRASSAHRQ